MINKDTKLRYICIAKNDPSGRKSFTTVKAGQIFNFDGFNLELNPSEKEFLNSLNSAEFKRIPQELADPTSFANFREFVKLAE